MAFYGFGTATRMLSHVLARPNIFSPEYTGGIQWIQKHGALLPHSWIREVPLKGLEGGDFGIYKGKNTTASNGRQASKAPPPPPGRSKPPEEGNGKEESRPYAHYILIHAPNIRALIIRIGSGNQKEYWVLRAASTAQ